MLNLCDDQELLRSKNSQFEDVCFFCRADESLLLFPCGPEVFATKPVGYLNDPEEGLRAVEGSHTATRVLTSRQPYQGVQRALQYIHVSVKATSEDEKDITDGGETEYLKKRIANL